MRKLIVFIILCLMGLLTAQLNAAHEHDWDADTLTDGFFGFGDSLADSGIDVGFCMTTVYQRNLNGGLSVDDDDVAGSYDLELTFDLERLLNMPGAIYMHGEGGWSDGIDPISVGSAFGVNGDAVGARAMDIVELYYQVGLTNNLELTIGKIDFTAFFDSGWYANDETAQFLNSALVNNPAIPFPDYSLGVILNYNITDDWYLMAGAADAEAIGTQCGFESTFDGDTYFFYIAETGIETSMDSANGALPGACRLGLWYDPQPKAYTGGSDQTNDHGFYLSCDQMFVKENETEDDTQGLGGFFRYGWAPEDKNDIAQVYSFGIQYQGLIDGRDEDVLGFGYANGIFSDKAAATYPEDSETVIEAYYSAVITNWMTLSPSIQYIANPANPGSGAIDDALVFGLRAQISF